MTELYLKYVLTSLTAALVLLAVFFLLRGHDLPGGGFIGGLMAAAALELIILSRGAEEVQLRLGRLMVPLAGLGLIIAVISILLGLVREGTVFAGTWFHVPVLEIDVGTPVTFDLGVFLVVMSVTSLFLLDLTLTRTTETEQLLEVDETMSLETVPAAEGDEECS